MQAAKKNRYFLPFILITSLFFLWGFAHNLNPILIPHLKKACQLTDVQSAFIDSAFFIAYFLMALPAGYFMRRFGYKSGIVLGLVLFAVGAFLFYPAAELRMFGFFLGALFVIASGLTFLETAANPYVTVLGSPETATQRLNFSQSFNGLAATLAPLVGGVFILSGTSYTDEELAAMPASQVTAYLDLEASSVQVPYLVIGLVVLAVALVLWRVPLPEIKEEEEVAATDNGESILKKRNLMLGVVAQFFYVGAQVCIASFFIRFSGSAAGVGEKTAAMLLAVALFGFMIGRFVGTFLMRFILPAKLLAIYAVLCFLLTVAAVAASGYVSIYALMGVQFFMSIMFPTIFSLSIQGLGAKTKQASSLLIMSIVGGAILPVVMGGVSDSYNIRVAYLVPAVCFLFVLYFAYRNMAVKQQEVALVH
ncbi:FHS family L-fucose permease-like MFS transporter [Pontibacter mucosus]|uniref:FHS family L-fucose permease-like MFS transporter n=1 Tax=Pontibacter mucosus TaxID=1649266 RepID=A0A2T5YFM5_9BACT|nr:L-fucose:H+ symporter permease [Pontibacter mucosus]PTX18076.1 FHS family L-fucose permease-like MFS transporter [Pontibacter mucosus]